MAPPVDTSDRFAKMSLFYHREAERCIGERAYFAACILTAALNLAFGAAQCAASSGAACTSDAAKAAIVETNPKEIVFPGCSVSTPICQGGDHGQARRMVAAWSCGSGASLPPVR
jgi:hypothetical protein